MKGMQNREMVEIHSTDKAEDGGRGSPFIPLEDVPVKWTSEFRDGIRRRSVQSVLHSQMLHVRTSSCMHAT